MLIFVPDTFGQTDGSEDNIKEYTINLYDTSRNRLIPIIIYSPLNDYNKNIVVFNHGYGENKGNDYKLYSHITRTLAQNGYFVISVQHELTTDDLLAMEGNLYKNRMSNWERGAENALFVINELKKLRSDLNWDKTSVIGHSNGGDMAMLFAKKYPQYLYKAISLDNRRMPLPRISKPRIYSLRGCDFPADEGVIPSAEEQVSNGITIIYFDTIKHQEMDNKTSKNKSRIINEHLLQILRE